MSPFADSITAYSIQATFYLTFINSLNGVFLPRITIPFPYPFFLVYELENKVSLFRLGRCTYTSGATVDFFINTYKEQLHCKDRGSPSISMEGGRCISRDVSCKMERVRMSGPPHFCLDFHVSLSVFCFSGFPSVVPTH